jgi:hypothetical protein
LKKSLANSEAQKQKRPARVRPTGTDHRRKIAS